MPSLNRGRAGLRARGCFLAYLGMISAALTMPADSRAQGSVGLENPGVENGGPTYSRVEYAKIWSITVEEYERYERLMLEDRYFGDPTTSPIAVLGKYARTPEERKRYAELYTRKKKEQSDRTAMWGMALADAAPTREQSVLASIEDNPEIRDWLGVRGLTADNFMEKPLFGSQSGAPTTDGGRVRLFLPDDCATRCDDAYDRLKSMYKLGKIAGLDVIFTDATSAKSDILKIVEWGSERGLGGNGEDSVLTETKAVTLNFDKKEYREIRGEGAELPMAIDSDGHEVSLR